MTENEQIGEIAVILSDGGCKKCDCDYNGRFNCPLIYDAELLYKAGYHKVEWISVEERLPSETESYLVVLDNEDIDIRLFNSKNDRYVTYYSMLNKFLFLDRGDWHTEDRVTHWMPLPELPSGAESEEQNNDG